MFCVFVFAFFKFNCSCGFSWCLSCVALSSYICLASFLCFSFCLTVISGVQHLFWQLKLLSSHNSRERKTAPPKGGGRQAAPTQKKERKGNSQITFIHLALLHAKLVQLDSVSLIALLHLFPSSKQGYGRTAQRGGKQHKTKE